MLMFIKFNMFNLFVLRVSFSLIVIQWYGTQIIQYETVKAYLWSAMFLVCFIVLSQKYSPGSSSLSQLSCFTPTAVTGFNVVADGRTCYVICIYLDFDGESVFHRLLTLTDLILYTGVHTKAGFWNFVYNSLRSEHSSSNVCDTVRQAQHG